MNYYAVVFLLRPPNLLRRGPFVERKNVCNSQKNGVRTRCAAIVNHPAILKILHALNLLRVVFLVRRKGRTGGNTILTPDIPQSEIAATNFYDRAKFWAKNRAKNLGRNFLGIFVLHLPCRTTHQNFSPNSSQFATHVATGVHWTGSPNKSIDQIGKNCPKNVRKLCFQPFWTIFGHFCKHFFDIFRTFCRHSHFRGCPTICPLQHSCLVTTPVDEISKFRARQRSGEGVVRRNGCPKEYFWRVRFFSAPLRFSLATPEW